MVMACICCCRFCYCGRFHMHGGAIFNIGRAESSPSGAFSYQVPIGLPPGSAGVAPELALVFDSRSGGNGFLGRGWDLSGLSQITRCGKAYSVDGVKTGRSLHIGGQLLFERPTPATKKRYAQSGWSGICDRASNTFPHNFENGCGDGGAQMILP